MADVAVIFHLSAIRTVSHEPDRTHHMARKGAPAKRKHE
ncbi:hypothetical protein O5623_19105 [Escherichia coli]|nr:hypothetical protein [Escherichia coli]